MCENGFYFRNYRFRIESFILKERPLQRHLSQKNTLFHIFSSFGLHDDLNIRWISQIKPVKELLMRFVRIGYSLPSISTNYSCRI